MPAPIVSCSTPQSLAESKAAHNAGLILVVVSPALATVFVALRVWSRALLKTFGWDDGLILVALGLSIADAGATWKFTLYSHGGYHTCDNPPMTLSDVRNLNLWLLIQQLLYNPILVVIKASVLLFLMRFKDSRWYIKRSLQVFFVINIMLGISIFLSDLFQCTPIHYMYDSISMDIAARIAAGADPTTGLTADGKFIAAGHCINQTAFVMSSASITTFTEALTLLIPMAMVWDLKINRKKKIIIIWILSLGWIVVAVSIARLVIFQRLLNPNNVDAGYGAHNQMSSIETNLAIIVACAPALKALTMRLAPRFLSSSKGYASNYAYGYGGYGDRSQGAGRHTRRNSRNFNPSSSAASRKLGRSKSDEEYSISINERSDSQEKIFRPGEIEKTVHINIEMDELDMSPPQPQGKDNGYSMKPNANPFPRM